MARWISAIRKGDNHFKVLVPLRMVSGMDWERCKWVTVEHCIDGKIIIRRLPGDEKRGNEGSKYPVVGD